MRQENALHFSQRSYRDSIKHVIAIGEKHCGGAGERRVQLVALQHFGELCGSGKDDLVLDSARQWDSIQVRHRADAKAAQRLFQIDFAPVRQRPGLALEPLGDLLRVVVHQAVARFCSSTFETPLLSCGLPGSGSIQTLTGS